MRDRGKRRKIAQSGLLCGSVRSVSGSCNGTANSKLKGVRENLNGVGPDCSLFDGGAFASRCSVKLINEVVSRFDLVKKDLVKSIGFEGLLYFPPMKQINRKFSMWLMSCVDDRSSTLNVGEHIRLRFDKGDVGHVFGIPASGESVLDTGVDQRDAKEKVIKHFLGREFLEQRSVKIAQEIVERDYARPLSKEDADRFRAAFVVFVVSNVLCPSAKFDYAAIDYWNAIQNPDDIRRFDWAGYVITRLLEAVGKLKQDISNNLKCPIITGCVIFLQVLYLDSIEIQGYSLPHNVLPRVRVFPFDRIRTMMLADNNYMRHCKGDMSLPIGQLRDATLCLYTWAADLRNESVDCRSGSMIALWESAVAMVRLFGVPFEAAGPLYVALVGFQEQFNLGLRLTGLQASKFVSLLVSIMMPYVQGFRYLPSCSSAVGNDGADLVGSAISNGTRRLALPVVGTVSRGCHDGGVQFNAAVRSTDSLLEQYPEGSPEVSSIGVGVLEKSWLGDVQEGGMKSRRCCHVELMQGMDVNVGHANVMAQFYSVLREWSGRNDLDLNGCSSVDSGSSILTNVAEGSNHGALPSPWELGYDWCWDDAGSVDIASKIASFENDGRNAIVHRDPKYIQVSFAALLSQFSGRCEMELDLFDALVRVARGYDDALYGRYGIYRWRLFFESDFMLSILTGKLDLVDPKLCYHLSLPLGGVDLNRTKLVYFPALVQCQWVCFVWQPEKNVIYVFDPGFVCGMREARVGVIRSSIFLLKVALHTLCQNAISGVTCDVRNAVTCILNIPDKHMDRLNRSGLLCSLFYRIFDGCELIMKSRQVDVNAVALKMFKEIENLKGNSGLLCIADEVG